ncbi:unnamed protein product [Clonostachys rosea]|uniref:Uncharacterized protein n=1 Tax=Bionectria ochroleuca TaxID=29856 RepID=A0ABY6UIY7_BIOOC|nr:unnamed protein product [Clonostachys rosea]
MTWAWLQQPWALESGSMIASFTQFVAMTIVCILFNGESVFYGPFITLNTSVSILSTGSKPSMLTAVASCISQANWFLFAGPPRRFKMVADSHRGPLGSIQMLLSSKFKEGSDYLAASSELATFSNGNLISDVLKGGKTLEQMNARAKGSLVVLVKGEEEHPLVQTPSVSERSSIQIIAKK